MFVYASKTCMFHLLLLFYIIYKVISSSPRTDLWYVGCYNLTSLNSQDIRYETVPVGKADLPSCCKFCLLKKCTEPICLPYGDGKEMVAIFTSSGPYSNNANINLQPDQIRKGYLETLMEKPTVGDNIVRAAALFNTTEEIGPYCEPVAPSGLSVVMNSSSIHEDESVLFSTTLTACTNLSYMWNMGDQITYCCEGPAITYKFPTTASYNITVTAWNEMGRQEAWKFVNVLPRQKVYIFTNGTVFSTDMYINFTAVTEEHGPLHFVWQFDGRLPERANRRSIIKRFTQANRYNVVVKASNRVSTFVSDVHTIFVQRRVIPNRLVASSSVLINSSVSFLCRINSGTNVSHWWNFGDGTERLGKDNDTHVYTSEGEYTVNVSVFNNVSSAYFTKQIFVVKEPCQPPPVKNMGPLKLQIRRYEDLHLGVTFEAAILCNISLGLQYQWSVVKSDGSVTPLPAHVNNRKQTITLPAFSLGYGNYTALARVQIVGNVVYSNYTVAVEVLPSDPVSVIVDGHHLFIDKDTVTFFRLNGTASFDPDYPGAQLRFHWNCVPVTAHENVCFNSQVLNPLQSSNDIILFPTASLNDNYDQFYFTLSVSNGDRKSSNAETLLSISPNTNFRLIEINCIGCKGSSVNWNKPFSVHAVCADCNNTGALLYLWTLYWINATESITPEVPFCRLKESMGVPSSLGAEDSYNGTFIEVHKTYPTPTATEKEYPKQYLIESDVLPELNHGNTENTESISNSYMMDLPLDLLEEGSMGGRELPNRGATKNRSGNSDLGSPALHTYDGVSGFLSGDGEGGIHIPSHVRNQTHNDFYSHFYGNIEEGFGGSGTRTEGDLYSVDGYSDEDMVTHDGANLVDLPYTPSPIIHLGNWLKLPISKDVFSRYTTSGISSQMITFNPYVLKPSKTYMLDITLATQEREVGRSQLYFTVNEMSQKMTCQVQPKDGIEVFTIFSIFCTSGKEDLYYEFSYQVGKQSRKTLYKGRDIQYYFTLPSGDSAAGYQVTIFTQITNLYGSQTQPCPVNVTVQPIVFGSAGSNYFSQQELFHDSLKNLSTLVLMGNHIEIRNYVVLLTTILNRLYTEDSQLVSHQQFQMRNELIFITVQRLSFSNQDELMDIVSMLRDLFDVSNQVSAHSAVLIINYTKSIVNARFESRELKRKLSENVILLISRAMEVLSKSTDTKNTFMHAVEYISELMVKYITLNNEQHFAVNTTLLDLQTNLYENSHTNVQTIGSSTFYLPQLLENSNRGKNTSITCYISLIKYFKKRPYFLDTVPSEHNGYFSSLTLYDCSTGRKLSTRDIVTPFKMEFENKRSQDETLNTTTFVLFRDKINFHQFNTTVKNKQSALQITIRFSKPKSRTFPVLLLIRHSKKPSPSTFNIKQIHWEEDSADIFIPADSIRDTGYSYLALMDADYKRHPKNKYISKVINYTVDVQWTQCLYWQNRHWDLEDCSPQKGTTAAVLTCSCTRLGLYTTASSQVSFYFSMEDVTQFLSTTTNPVPCVIIALCIFHYLLLVIFCKTKDKHEDQKDGFVFLQDNSPNDQQKYAIMIDVGFRSRPQSTAKVHIVLHGEDVVSETRELYCPDKPLFERNSRHTFIMSVPDSLGPLWKIHVWHNNSGHSPSLYISHLVIKDLQSGTSWFFYAECWLAVDEGDGKVEREFTAVGHGIGFRKLFYCKFTEYLEDFHFWGSVFSRPSYSWFTHTQRITACFVLLVGYMCFNIVLIHQKDDQYTVEIGLIDISTISTISGLQVTLAVYPIVVLLSLLFRFSEKKLLKDSGEERFKVVKDPQITPTAGHQHSVSAADTIFESNLTWHHFQYWAYDAWKKKYERDISASSIHCGNGSRTYKTGCPSLSNQSSSGFQDCGSNSDHKTGLKEFKDCTNGTCSQYCSDHSLFKTPVLHGYKVLPSWCIYVAWTLCTVISLFCVTITVMIGIRFGPTKCVLWLHAVFFSVIYCIFIVQPLSILLISLCVAWRKKERTDFFLEALSEDVKYIIGERCQPIETFRAHSHLSSHETSNFEKILAARKRARYLKLARPPTPAQLKLVKDKIRRKTVIQKVFRELTVYIIMTSMLIFITMGKYSQNDYFLNQAVRKEFTRNVKQPFGEIITEDHWWNWSFNVLLDGLYWNKWYNNVSASTEAGPIEGKFFLIGTPIMRKLSVANNSACMIPSFLVSQYPDCTLTHDLLKGARGWSDIQDTGENQEKYYQCGQIQCYSDMGSIVNLGRLRNEAYSALLNLRNQRWIEKGTRALAVQFVLYNPPTNLFTSVSLLTELPRSGGIITSSVIESVTIYRITILMDYFIMVFELMFLGMILIFLYLQLSIMTQRGIRSYWQEPWNWVEVSIIVFSLCYYIIQLYHFLLAVDIIDHLQKGFFGVFINFSLIAACEKWTCCLHGIILFFMIIKLIKLLRFYKMMAPCVAVFHLSCSSSLFIMLIGIVFMLAYSSVGHIMFSENYPFSSALTSILTIFTHLLGVRGSNNIHFLHSQIKSKHFPTACFYGTLFVIITLLWNGMIKGILTSVVKCSKKVHRSKHLVTFRDVASHIRGLVLSIVGRQRHKTTDSMSVTGSNFYLDEFEDLIDELLFRLNAISNSLHHSLPAKPHCYTEEDMNHLETGSNFSFKQTTVEHDNYLQEERMFVESVTVKNEVQRFSSVPDGYIAPEDIHAKNYSECVMDTKLESEECVLKTEHGNQLSFRNNTFSTDFSQCVYTEKRGQHVLHNHKEMWPAVLSKDPCVDTISLQCDKIESRKCSHMRCTSANILSKTRKPLKRSYTIIIEPLESSSIASGNKVIAHESRTPSTQKDDKGSQEQKFYIFQGSHCEIKIEKELQQPYAETVVHRPTQQNVMNKNVVLQGDDKTCIGYNVDAVQCSIKQCW
ncbi:polycystin-1-like protein 1 isoform X2 [Pseudophryne corroboree]|uniref:polycystin-1-like protein 1 isoform X2 n=1 Tax=Pseudophryne corroboree TaxID=495146 RepID=UPI0030820EE7